VVRREDARGSRPASPTEDYRAERLASASHAESRRVTGTEPGGSPPRSTAATLADHFTAMISIGWMSGSFASKSVATLPSSTGIRPLRCACLPSSAANVSKMP
jgi:hypothetical protein